MLHKSLTQDDIDRFYTDLESIRLLKPVAELARISGLSTGNVSEYLNKKKKPSRKLIDAFYKHYKNSINVPQETSAQEHEKPYLKKRQELKNGDKADKAIPFYDAPAAAGLTETEMTAIHAPAGTIDVGDLLSDSQAAIRIYGNSMLPNYPPGCVVGLARCNKSFIEPGEVYVIETSDRRILKRLFYKGDISDGDWLTCYSDNIMKFEGGARDGRLAYPPFDIPKKEIINLFVVTGVIKRNANSVIINR